MFRKLVISTVALTVLSVLALGSNSETPEEKASRELRQAEQAKVEAAEAAQREAEIVAREAESTETATFVAQLQIDTRKPNGKHWDTRKGKPDPLVTITVTRTGRVLVGEAKQNVFSAIQTFADVKVSPGDQLNVVLEDSDMLSNDEVGVCTVTFEPGGTAECGVSAGSLIIDFK